MATFSPALDDVLHLPVYRRLMIGQGFDTGNLEWSSADAEEIDLNDGFDYTTVLVEVRNMIACFSPAGTGIACSAVALASGMATVILLGGVSAARMPDVMSHCVELFSEDYADRYLADRLALWKDDV